MKRSMISSHYALSDVIVSWTLKLSTFAWPKTQSWLYEASASLCWCFWSHAHESITKRILKPLMVKSCNGNVRYVRVLSEKSLLLLVKTEIELSINKPDINQIIGQSLFIGQLVNMRTKNCRHNIYICNISWARSDVNIWENIFNILRITLN